MTAATSVTEPALCGGKKRHGGTCTQPAGWGTAHQGTGRCKLHGGCSPQAQMVGVVTLARREMAVMGRPLDVEPHEALLECIRIAAGEVQYASEQIAELDPEDVVGPIVTTHRRPLRFEKGAESSSDTVVEVRHEAPALHVWIVVRQQAMDRLVSYSKIAIAAGIAERQVRVAERQGELFAQAVRGILADLGVIEHPEAPRIVRKHLQLIAGQAA